MRNRSIFNIAGILFLVLIFVWVSPALSGECFKKSENLRKDCSKTKEKIDKLVANKTLDKKEAKDLEYALSNWDRCMDKADEELLNCRYEKKHFKKGCSKKKLKKELSGIVNQENKCRDDMESCRKTCEEKYVKDKKKVSEKEFEKWRVESQKCLMSCKEKYLHNKCGEGYFRKQRNKVMKECVSMKK